MHPEILSTFITPDACHALLARFPVASAMQARHVPNILYEGRTYVPYTGTVVAPYKNNVTGERPIGFYMEYRALRLS